MKEGVKEVLFSEEDISIRTKELAKIIDEDYKVKERLEKRVREPLSDVSIAAAGRVLKTKRVKARYQFNSETKVTEDHIRSLDMMGVEQAYDEIRKEQTDSGKKFFCVGYSIVKYYLNVAPIIILDTQFVVVEQAIPKSRLLRG